jgi:cell division protein FtsZ
VNVVKEEEVSSPQQGNEVLQFELKQQAPEPEPMQLISEYNVSNKNTNSIKAETTQTNVQNTTAGTSSGFLAKPSNIYAEPKREEPQSLNPNEAPASQPAISEQPEFEMKLVMREELPEAADEQKLSQPVGGIGSAEDLAMQDDVDDQKRRAQERIQKLRNLSFNMNTADASNEFDSVPAYIRRNMELFGNTLTSVENFYSKYTVKPDENDKGQISSINTFLDGKKPD